MIAKLDQYKITLERDLSTITNPKETGLVYALLYLIERAKKDQELEEVRLDYVRNKIAKVACFSDRYKHMLDFLESHNSSLIRT